MNLWTQRFLRIAAPVLFRAMAAWAILGAIGNDAGSQVIRSWASRYNGPGNAGDGATAMVLDAEGNVYITGYSFDYGSGLDYATIKYDSAGVPIWVARYNGAGNGDDHRETSPRASLSPSLASDKICGLTNEVFRKNARELAFLSYHGVQHCPQEAAPS